MSYFTHVCIESLPEIGCCLRVTVSSPDCVLIVPVLNAKIFHLIFEVIKIQACNEYGFFSTLKFC